MNDLKGRTAFVTGGASGIGWGIAQALGAEGMNVMVADIEQSALDRAVETLRAKQVKAEGILVDVASRDSMAAGALATLAKFSKVHVVVNNAGIATGGPIGAVPEKDWDWIIDVNVFGVIHGVEVFAPLIESHGEGGHIVNTASMASHIAGPGMEPYAGTKFAVIAMTEGWHQQLAPKNIGVSALCPGYIRTNILSSRRNRGSQYGADVPAHPPGTPESPMARMSREKTEAGLAPEICGARVVEAIKNNELYIFTHAAEFRPYVEQRLERLRDAFARSEQSPALAGQPGFP